MKIEQKLLDMKADIEKAKTGKAQAEGRLEGLMWQLKDAHKCKTLEQAKTKIAKLNTSIEKMKASLEKGFEELEQAYDW